MEFEVRAKHEVQLVFAAETHTRDFAWLGFIEEIYFEDSFTTELRPYMYLPFVIRNKPSVCSNPKYFVNTIATMLTVGYLLREAKIDSELLVLFVL